MNKLVSGAIGVPVKITDTRISLPDILELKGKRIKHIDFADAVLQTVSGDNGVANVLPASSLSGAFLNLMEQNTQEYKIKGMPLKNLALSVNYGNRPFINKIVDFPNSYIDFPMLLQYPALQDKIIFLVFWYDEPQIMQRIQEAGKTVIQNFEVDVFDTNFRKIGFGDNRTLTNKKFRNLFFHYLNGYGTTPAGKKLITLTDAQRSFITLQRENLKFVRNVPVYLFYQVNNYYPVRLQNITFDFLNSYIEVAPAVSLQANSCFFFNAEIDDND